MIDRRGRLLRAGALAVALGSASLGGGCSLLFVDGPGTPAPGSFERAGCTRSYAWPTIDAVLAGVELAQGLYVLSLPASRFDGVPVPRGAVLGLTAAWVAVYGASAAVGVSRVHACLDSADAPAWRSPPPYQPPRQSAAEAAAEAAAVQQELREREAAAARAAKAVDEDGRAPRTSGAPDGGVPSN